MARSTMSVFGDPHYRIYGSDEADYWTCAHEGSMRELLMNDYVRIYGNNGYVNETMGNATVMTGVLYYTVLKQEHYNTVFIQAN